MRLWRHASQEINVGDNAQEHSLVGGNQDSARTMQDEEVGKFGAPFRCQYLQRVLKHGVASFELDEQGVGLRPNLEETANDGTDDSVSAPLLAA
jgi:hypothetical protein